MNADLEAQDRDFFDILYQQWSKTTWANCSYWMPFEDEDFTFGIKAVVQETDSEIVIARGLTEPDADFICGLHGALPDLTRRLHDATDEAVRKDEANDDAQVLLADALRDNMKLTEMLDRAGTRLQELGETL
ncbi:hypothetical protein [Mycolicibacterium aichiense]|uniref:Uncharacterized protein n=1 Tax=Mycolicibacterium aichiense TaxID=1799 RepID=A0A378VCH5_9MYCO|nr:hypothetical protein [Mycolicibacterium aichiense]QFG08006.1 hypothetical protein SEA_HERBERTWM_37 [Mycobacterium phage Herbertwm]BBX09433.1 hypothetical protein MAIC_42360 [Mycolicibacterium aichiense]SUA13998.1 Uncharacterised protein [Mycolicibacterium aichiense]SUA14424.1 Uncharacterised protein [Mycolicibacterium aichiense]